ncbi:MAG: UDP-glucose 4-epimerase GalE [Eubacterium sp.]|nr:UDP-glucose 4-epimerase GalE [Eubacterium sp.]
MMILVTGGAGYIGSHVCLELLQSGYEVAVVDNLSNSSADSLKRVEDYTGKTLKFYEGDVMDAHLLKRIFDENKIDGVIHFAALKAVGESTEKPLEYYVNNVQGTLTLLDAMKEVDCKNIVFSSSATVYGTPETNPITEEFPTGGCTNPYGRTKYMMEEILKDLQKSDPQWNVVLFRYFNPIGAHMSGVIGEDPNGIPNNLMPYVAQVASGKLELLSVYGDDYDTPDGTGVRDYIHVVDLADAHVKALSLFDKNIGLGVYNLGTGRGTSVLELVHTFQEVNGCQVPYVIMERRPGDIAACWCDASKARKELGWEAKYDVADMCRDTWNWEKKGRC